MQISKLNQHYRTLFTHSLRFQFVNELLWPFGLGNPKPGQGLEVGNMLQTQNLIITQLQLHSCLHRWS